MGLIGKRLAITVITLFLVSVFTFGAFRLIPGDAALLSLGTEASASQIEALRAEMGLDRSFPVQYLSWLRGFFSGNLGNSARFKSVSISEIILERLPVTMVLAGLSFAFVLLIAIPVSLLSVKKENSLTGRLAATLTAINISIPGFFLGVLFIWIFGVLLKFFIPGGYVSYRESVSAFLGYLIFPALAIALPNAALVVKFLRSAIFGEFNKAYVRTAQSKGSSRGRILRRHVLKNAFLPVITLLGMIAGEILSGSIVIEQVFGIPGIGRLLITSITSRDYLVIQTIVIYIAFAVILTNTTADIILRIADPRIRLSERFKQ